jgi:hypothetical protein
VIGHWLAHPLLTRRARALAKADPSLGLYDSLDAARAAVRRERRQAAIASVLHRKIKAVVKDKDTADIAVHVYDLDEIAARLAAGADYAGLTALIAADLEPARLAPTVPAPAVQPIELAPGEALEIAALGTPVAPAESSAFPAALPQVQRAPVMAILPANRPVSSPPADSRRGAPTVAETVRVVAAEFRAQGVEPDPRTVARIVGTTNVRHVARVMEKASTPAELAAAGRTTADAAWLNEAMSTDEEAPTEKEAVSA